ncbi:MAG: hypothetical protein AAF349_28855 [Cyanobacteria bacterium P01_A01_bin.68]
MADKKKSILIYLDPSDLDGENQRPEVIVEKLFTTNQILVEKINELNTKMVDLQNELNNIKGSISDTPQDSNQPMTYQRISHVVQRYEPDFVAVNIDVGDIRKKIEGIDTVLYHLLKPKEHNGE